jgi:hypothetical protein
MLSGGPGMVEPHGGRLTAPDPGGQRDPRDRAVTFRAGNPGWHVRVPYGLGEFDPWFL